MAILAITADALQWRHCRGGERNQTEVEIEKKPCKDIRVHSIRVQGQTRG